MRPPSDSDLATSRRRFLVGISLAAATPIFCKAGISPNTQVQPQSASANVNLTGDKQRMRDLAAWTALTFDTPMPVPYGAEIVHTEGRQRVTRATNAVRQDHDPSAHAEIRAIRMACNELKSHSLRGHTLYTTCEPCPMCMSCSLWAGLDRVVFGATIADAARFSHQILIPAPEVVRRADMKCIVDGPVEHELCLALFTDPRMQRVFEMWKQGQSGSKSNR